MDLNSKRILITQNDIYSINGSSVIVLELAKELMNLGASVTVYTYFLHNPLKKIFKDNNIRVVEARDAKFEVECNLSLREFDYIWVQHQVLPLGVINDLGAIDGQVSTPAFIFNHMSSLDHIADEFPYVWALEDKLSSVSLYNSVETKEKQEDSLKPEKIKNLYQNPAPVDFSKHKESSRKRLKRVLVVSNHPPKEIIKLKEVLKEDGVEVMLLGESQEKQELISIELLKGYDVIISIGKTVQNCLVAGIPVYVYDYLGGPGYLNDSNFELSEKNNFSGRGFDRKSVEQIREEIMGMFREGSEYIATIRDKSVELYSIDRSVSRVFSELNPIAYGKFDEKYIKYLVYSHNYSREHRRASCLRVIAEKNVEEQYTKTFLLKRELEDILQSKSYRLGGALAYPLRKVKDLKSKK